jgi:hypothetical protein
MLNFIMWYVLDSKTRNAKVIQKISSSFFSLFSLFFFVSQGERFSLPLFFKDKDFSLRLFFKVETN